MSSIWSRPEKVLKNEHLWNIPELIMNNAASLTTGASGRQVQPQDWKVRVKKTNLISHRC